MHVHTPAWKKSSAQKFSKEERKSRPECARSAQIRQIKTIVLETNKQVILAFMFVFIVYRTVSTNQVQWNRSERFSKILKAHANGRNIVGQQHATLLGPTCFIRLHGTTTMLALVGTCYI